MGQPQNSTEYEHLVPCLAGIPDPRGKQGRQYTWLFLLTIIATAMLSGESTPLGISQWLKRYETELVASLRPARNRMASSSTIQRVLRKISIEALEEAVSRYLRGLRPAMGESGQIVTLTGERLQCLAVDGKTVRCATAHGQVTHLVSVVAHEDGIVLTQVNAQAKLDEITQARKLLASLSLEHTVTTFDALHTSFPLAKQIRQGGGHYLFVVKRNRKTLFQAIEEAFSVLPPQGTCERDFWQYESCSLSCQGHGRTVHYFLESKTALNHYLDFPDVALVARRTRSSRNHHTRELSVSVEFLITSLPRSQVSLAQLAHIRRQHWTIENVTHYPRDVSFGEDRCHVHSGSAPQALAAFRNAIIGTLRVQGWPYLPNGFHFCRSNLHISLRWLGALSS